MLKSRMEMTPELEVIVDSAENGEEPLGRRGRLKRRIRRSCVRVAWCERSIRLFSRAAARTCICLATFRAGMRCFAVA